MPTSADDWIFIGPENKMIRIQNYLKYSDRPSIGQSSIRMVIFWTKFVSGYQMVSHLVLTIRKPNIFCRFLNGLLA
jgi:hypothetical protein